MLQRRVVALLEELNEQARVDRSTGLKGVVLRAVPFHCHQSNQQSVLVNELAAIVNQIYSDEGVSRKGSAESVGHALKNFGLLTRRLGSNGRGLVLDKSIQIQVHQLSRDNDFLLAPACADCVWAQSQQSKEVV